MIRVNRPDEISEIVVCGTCLGQGVLHKSELHSRDRSLYWSTKCDTCEGSGRLVKRTVTEYNRFHPPHPVPKEQGSLD